MSAKNLDQHGRWRSKTVAFRVTNEENDLIDRFAALSGMTKQDYIIHRLTCQDVVVQGNPRVHKALKQQMDLLLQELRELTNAGEITPELASVLDYLFRIYDGMKSTECTPLPQAGVSGRCHDCE